MIKLNINRMTPALNTSCTASSPCRFRRRGRRSNWWLTLALLMMMSLPAQSVFATSDSENAGTTGTAKVTGTGTGTGTGTESTDQQELRLWKLLASAKDNFQNYAVLVRHALAPGGGDPANFTIDDCATQRNLSDEGREQARHIGSLFDKNGFAENAGVNAGYNLRLYSSAWCRCVETAELMAHGPVENLPSLNSFFRNYAQSEPQTNATLRWLQQRASKQHIEQAGENQPDGKRLAVLVTHQVNITALTGVFPASGEMVVVQIGEAALDGNATGDDTQHPGLRVLGTISTHRTR